MFFNRTFPVLIQTFPFFAPFLLTFQMSLPTFSSQSYSFFKLDLLIFSSQFSAFFQFNPAHFWVRLFHLLGSLLPAFRMSDFLNFWVRPLIFWVSPSHFSESDLLFFWVRPSHFLESVLPIFLSQTFQFYSVKYLFNHFEFILQFMCLIRRCLTWDVNRKYIFQ